MLSSFSLSALSEDGEEEGREGKGVDEAEEVNGSGGCEEEEEEEEEENDDDCEFSFLSEELKVTSDECRGVGNTRRGLFCSVDVMSAERSVVFCS